MSKQVVARYQDGRVVKGTSMDVDPNKPVFHVKPEGGPALEVRMGDLKALFFVRSLQGNPARNDAQTLDPADPRSRGSTLVRLGFADGETLTGLSIGYPPKKNFFFVLPVDPQSNNVRVLVNREAVTSMEKVA